LDPDSGAPGSVLALAHEYERAGHTVRVLSYDSLPPILRGRASIVAFPALVAGFVLANRVDRRYEVIDASSADLADLPRFLVRSRRWLTITRSHGMEHGAHAEYLRSAQLGEFIRRG